jgi:hypothetical protein
MRAMTERDQFIQAQVTPVLQPGEQILNQAFMVKQPGLIWQMLLVGGLLLFLMTKAFYVVCTDRRILMIKTKLGFFSPKLQNNGIDVIDLAQVKQVTTSGLLNNRSMTFHMVDGRKDTLRIAPWAKWVTGQGQFLEQVPARLNQRQLPA